MEHLINYPCGLGDCLMLTPTLREYYKTYGIKLSVAILEKFRGSEIFKNNPYVEKTYYLDNIWDNNSQFSFPEENHPIANQYKLNITYLKQLPIHRIYITGGLLGFKLVSTQIDVFTSKNDVKIANEVINKFVGDNPYGFIQTNTGQPKKDLPYGYGKKWLKKYKKLNHFIEIGDTFKYDDYNINVQFEILRRANAVCIPDSVFYHACSGIGKDIDFVYFSNGETYRTVKNLNYNIRENVYCELPNII